MADLDIAVVNWKTPALTIRCVKSYLAFTPNCQVIIIDNGSEDSSVDEFRAVFKENQQVLILPGRTNIGYGPACNLALSVVPNKSKYVVASNSDIVATPNWFEPLRKCLEEEKAGIVGPKLLNFNNKIVAAGVVGENRKPILRGWLADSHLFSTKEDVIMVTGAVMAFKRDIFEKIGKFPEDLEFYYEDNFICYRSRELGYRVIYCPEVPMYHELHGSERRTIVLAEKFRKAKAVFEAKVGYKIS